MSCVFSMVLVLRFFQYVFLGSLVIFEVMKWQSLKRLCDQNFPDKKFRNDTARRAFLVKKGVKLQKDNTGVEGVAVPKDDSHHEEKEIKIGKRLAASKIRQADYGEDASKSAVKEAHQANSRGLVINNNTLEPRSCFNFNLFCSLFSHDDYCTLPSLDSIALK